MLSTQQPAMGTRGTRGHNKRKRPLHNERWWCQQMGDVPVATNGDVKNSQVEREATVPEMKKGTTRGSGAKRGGGTAGREAVVF